MPHKFTTKIQSVWLKLNAMIHIIILNKKDDNPCIIIYNVDEDYSQIVQDENVAMKQYKYGHLHK